ncbi:MAG: hypothetical protein H6982_15205 [Chromatiales bacterium]|nr:hypothetical protein [Chromatiales bacterium]
MHCRRRSWSVIGAAWLVAWVAALPSSAGEVPRVGVEWVCSQEHDERHEVACLAEPVPLPAATRTGGLPEAEARGPGPDMRPVALRGVEQIFLPTPWRVPLFAPPSDERAVEALLDQILCGGAPACSVRLRPSRIARR